MEITSFIKEFHYLKRDGHFKYDKLGQYIWLMEPNGNHQKIADLRGWGAIQNLFKDEKGVVDTESAAKFQDQIGEWVAEALNQKLKKS